MAQKAMVSERGQSLWAERPGLELSQRGDIVPWASLLTLTGLRTLRWRNNMKAFGDGGGGGTPWVGGEASAQATQGQGT